MKKLPECIQKLEEWFNKKLTPDQFVLFAKGCKHIPLQALIAIVEKIIKTTPAMPSRFPTLNRIHEEHRIWRNEHPESSVQHEEIPCKYCGGEGVLRYLIYAQELNRIDPVICLCGHCENYLRHHSRNSPRRRLTMAQIEKEPHYRGHLPYGSVWGCISDIAVSRALNDCAH